MRVRVEHVELDPVVAVPVELAPVDVVASRRLTVRQETLEQREAGTTEAVVDEQLDAVLDAAGIAAFAKAVIAYEPVWAIGTGMTATPEQAQDVHRHIRARLAGENEAIADGVQILYGGSMKGENAAGLLAQPDIDGGLIGGASLKADDFLAIAQAAASQR
mgnify:CR=1 FL=1